MKKRNLLTVALSLCMTMSFASQIYAANNVSAVNTITESTQNTAGFYTQRRNPEELSAGEIITELYSNINNAMIQDAAKTEAMLLTGEKEIATDEWGIVVGTYDEALWQPSAFPLGDLTQLRAVMHIYGDESKTYTLYAPVSAAPDAQKMQENKAALNLLYNTAWNLKEETVTMSERDTAITIADWIRANIKQNPTVKSPATCLTNGVSDCSGYSGLFEIFGSFCGLEVKEMNGYFKEQAHGWNKVKIDGSWTYMDVNWHNYLVDEATLGSKGYQIMCASGDKVNDIFSNTTFRKYDFSK